MVNIDFSFALLVFHLPQRSFIFPHHIRPEPLAEPMHNPHVHRTTNQCVHSQNEERWYISSYKVLFSLEIGPQISPQKSARNRLVSNMWGVGTELTRSPDHCHCSSSSCFSHISLFFFCCCSLLNQKSYYSSHFTLHFQRVKGDEITLNWCIQDPGHLNLGEHEWALSVMIVCN